MQSLRETIEREPAELGYTFAIWTTARLRDHLAQLTGVHLSVGYLRTLIRQLGYVYRRPKRVSSRKGTTMVGSAHVRIVALFVVLNQRTLTALNVLAWSPATICPLCRHWNGRRDHHSLL